MQTAADDELHRTRSEMLWRLCGVFTVFAGLGHAYAHATEQHPTIILICFVW